MWGYVSTNNSNGHLVVFNNSNAIGLSSCIVWVTTNVSILFCNYISKDLTLKNIPLYEILIAWFEIMVFDFI